MNEQEADILFRESFKVKVLSNIKESFLELAIKCSVKLYEKHIKPKTIFWLSQIPESDKEMILVKTSWRH